MRWHNSFFRPPSLPRQPENRPAGYLGLWFSSHQRRVLWPAVTRPPVLVTSISFPGPQAAATSHQERVLRPPSVPQPSQATRRMETRFLAFWKPLTGLLAAIRSPGSLAKCQPGSDEPPAHLLTEMSRSLADTACRCVDIQSSR
jgi:hypothetical protein